MSETFLEVRLVRLSSFLPVILLDGFFVCLLTALFYMAGRSECPLRQSAVGPWSAAHLCRPARVNNLQQQPAAATTHCCSSHRLQARPAPVLAVATQQTHCFLSEFSYFPSVCQFAYRIPPRQIWLSACMGSLTVFLPAKSLNCFTQHCLTSQCPPPPFPRLAVRLQSQPTVPSVSTLNWPLLTVSCKIQWPGFCKNLFEI